MAGPGARAPGAWLAPLCLCGVLAQASQPMVWGDPTELLNGLRTHPESAEAAIEYCKAMSEACAEGAECPREQFISEGGDVLIAEAMYRFLQVGAQGKEVQRSCSEAIGKIAKGDAVVQTAMFEHNVIESLMAATLLYGDSPDMVVAIDALAQFTDTETEKAEEVYTGCVEREASSDVAPVAFKLIKSNPQMPNVIAAGLRYARHLCHSPKVNSEIVQSGFLGYYGSLLEAYPEGEVPLEVLSLMTDCFDFGMTGLGSTKEVGQVAIAAASLMATYNTPELKGSADARRAVAASVKTFRKAATLLGNAGREDLLSRNVKEEILKGMRETHTIPCDDFKNKVLLDACFTLATLDVNGLLPPECMTQY